MSSSRRSRLQQKAALLGLLIFASLATTGCTAVVVGAAAGAAAGYAVSELSEDDND